MNISLCEHKLGQMPHAFKQSLTWMPKRRFLVSLKFFIVSAAPTLLLNIYLTPTQNSNAWRPNMACLDPLRTYVLFTCPRLHQYKGLAGLRQRRRKRQLSFTIVWLTRGCWFFLYTDGAKTTMNNFRWVGTTLSGDFRELGQFFSLTATLERFFHVEIFWLVG